jgi:GTP pyrophosphokinase
MTEILNQFEANNLAKLYQYIGSGILPLREIITAITNTLYANHSTLEPPTGALNQIFLESLDPACIKLSRCCSPIPTEKGLLGLLSNRGLSVHKKECTTLSTLSLKREDIVEVRWNFKKTFVTKPQTILILNAASRNRVMMMLGVAPLQMKIQEVIFLSSLPGGGTAWEINFTVETLQDLKDTLAHFDKTGIEYELAIEQ